MQKEKIICQCQYFRKKKIKINGQEWSFYGLSLNQLSHQLLSYQIKNLYKMILMIKALIQAYIKANK